MNNLKWDNSISITILKLIGKLNNPSTEMNMIANAIFYGGTYMRETIKYLRNIGMSEKDIETICGIAMQMHYCPSNPKYMYIGKDGRDYVSLEEVTKANQRYLETIYPKKEGRRI